MRCTVGQGPQLVYFSLQLLALRSCAGHMVFDMASDPAQAEFESRQQFTEVIVNFARDADALLFTGGLQASGQGA